MIKDITRKQVVAKDHQKAGFFGKMFGLMFSRARNLVFAFDDERKRGLHTFFVFYPIDILFLNSKKIMIEKTKMKPFSVYNPESKARYILELKKGLSDRDKIGDRISFY